ncbi:hypothetical protein RND81_04G024900 [Saponaria officinalis]|uniref:RIN4 pathogenic type III effector avirulence factor Avr cleavage site domain-containing protein n=1 Tax=Saponaria officinalis TaxID=3572 RepID=A0AAW1LH50_SAPOF
MSKSSTSGGKSLPKFGEWDVKNPSSGEGFTVIFNAARDEKKNEANNNPSSSNQQSPIRDNNDKQRDKRNHNQDNATV